MADPRRAAGPRRRLRPALVLVAVSLAAALLATFAAYRARDWTLQQLHFQGSEALLERVGEIRSWLDAYDYLPFLLTQNRDVRSLLLYPNQDMGVRVSRYLEQTNLVADSTALFVLDVQGRAVAFSNWRDQQDFYLRSHAGKDYFLDARRGEQGRRFALAEGSGSPAFYLSAPIYDARRFVGAAVVRLNLELLQRRLGSAGLPWFLSSSDGSLIAASSPDWVGRAQQSLSGAEQVQRLLSGTEIRRWPEVLDGRRTAQSVELDDLGWTLTVLQHSGPAARNGRTAGLFTLGGSVAFCLLLLYLRERHLKQRSQRETQQALRDARDFLEDKVRERTLELRLAQQELVQAEKLAALGRMSSAVVHELNQPLTAMRTYVAICHQLVGRPDRLAANLDQIDELVERMALITRQLKTFAYRKPERLEPVSLGDCIDKALAQFGSRLSDSGVALSLSRPACDDRVDGDSARLEQVLINLIGNSLDAMAQGDRPQRLELRLERQGDWLQLDVCDSGTGIAEDVRGKLFDPFVTTKSIGSGLGLGLAIVRGIVRDLDGDIEAQNRDGSGACFRLRLPVHRVGDTGTAPEKARSAQ